MSLRNESIETKEFPIVDLAIGRLFVSNSRLRKLSQADSYGYLRYSISIAYNCFTFYSQAKLGVIVNVSLAAKEDDLPSSANEFSIYTY